MLGLIYSISCSSVTSAVLTSPLTSPLTSSVDSPIDRGGFCSVRGHQCLEMTGPRLNNTIQEMSSKMYGPDQRLDLIVANAMPQLQVSEREMRRCSVVDGLDADRLIYFCSVIFRIHVMNFSHFPVFPYV